MARPVKLTEQVESTLIEGVRAGLFLDQACSLAGIAPQTFYRWKQRAVAGGEQDPGGRYAEFLGRVLQAEAEAEREAIEVVKRAAERDPKSAQWYLQHRWPARWQGSPTHSTAANGSEYQRQVFEREHDPLAGLIRVGLPFDPDDFDRETRNAV